jgi:hypothetical protein
MANACPTERQHDDRGGGRCVRRGYPPRAFAILRIQGTTRLHFHDECCGGHETVGRRECATWRILASLFGPKMRRNGRNATRFWPNATSNRADREKGRWRKGLHVAHLCTKWRMMSHRGRVAEIRGGAWKITGNSETGRKFSIVLCGSPPRHRNSLLIFRARRPQFYRQRRQRTMLPRVVSRIFCNWIMVCGGGGPVGNAQRCPQGSRALQAAMRRISFLCSSRSSMLR